MTRRALALVAALALLIAAPLPAGKYTPEDVRKAIKDLGDKRFTVREKASKLLWEAGADAESPLREALASDDAETVRRARLLLDRFNWGIFPDTPPEIIDQINAFRGGDRNVRLQVVGKLLGMGKPGYSTLKRLAEMETNPADKQALFAQMALEAQKALPGLLIAGDLPATEELLERCLLGGSDEAYTNYAAYYAAANRLPEAIARWEKEWAVTKSATSGRLLVHLCRAKGDFARGRELATAIGDSLVEQLLWEASDWKGLSAHYRKSDPPGGLKEASGLGMRAAVHRLAGDSAAFEAAVKELLKLGESDDRFEVRSAAESLLLNGRSDDAMKMLLKKKSAPALTFDLLFAQMRYAEAFALAEGTKVDEKDERFRLDMRYARALHILGERGKALERFRRLGEGLHDGGDLSAARDLVRTMARLGLKEEAREMAGRYLVLLNKLDVRDGWDQLLEPLFDQDAAVAVVWWPFLRGKLGDDPALMKTLSRLLKGEKVEQRDNWCAELARQAPDPARIASQGTATSPAFAAAVVLLKAGQEERARPLFEQAIKQLPDASEPIRYADFLAGRGRHREAAAWYERAGKLEPGNALALFLRGDALDRSGEAKEGKRLMVQAHRAPLGNEYDRGRFASELERRGFPKDAKQERDLTLTFGWYRYWHMGNVLTAAAHQAVRDKDYDRAIAYYEKAIVGCMKMGASYAEHQAYLVVPQTVPRIRIRALLEAKKFDEAMKEIRASLAVLPGNIELAIAAVPALDQSGRRQDSDAMFAAVRDRFDELCRSHPSSAFAHNSFAWLCANCGRDLERAVDHARAAVKLEPNDPRYLDTLAEVQFRRGESAEAVATMKACLTLEPARPYYAKQLARYQKGDRTAPIPDSDDE